MFLDWGQPVIQSQDQCNHKEEINTKNINTGLYTEVAQWVYMNLLLFNSLNPMGNQERISPQKYQYIIKQTVDENKEEYWLGDY